MWVYPPNCRTKVGARWSPSFPRQSLARRRARNIVQVHAHALNGLWECYHVVRIGLGAIWGDHGRRRSLHFTTPHFCLKKGWVYPLLSISHFVILLFLFLSLCRLCVCVFLCSHWSLVDVPLICFCPADHVPDWQPRVLLGMVEARSVNVKKTKTTTTGRQSKDKDNGIK